MSSRCADPTNPNAVRNISLLKFIHLYTREGAMQRGVEMEETRDGERQKGPQFRIPKH